MTLTNIFFGIALGLSLTFGIVLSYYLLHTVFFTIE